MRCILLKFYIKPQHYAAQGAQMLSCILLKFYIKPQQFARLVFFAVRCILLKFYIKPQLIRILVIKLFVVSYWNSTSNHNNVLYNTIRSAVVSYWNSTSNHNLAGQYVTTASVVSYWNSTSNHNLSIRPVYYWSLYLIEILHQTTTMQKQSELSYGCILLKFYIKPQQFCRFNDWRSSCILLKFYIKPQPSARVRELLKGCILLKFYIKPQRLRHQQDYQNGCILLKFYIKPQPSEHQPESFNSCILLKFYIKPQPFRDYTQCHFVVSYWNSTSNHNVSVLSSSTILLYLIEILHQTTTPAFAPMAFCSCILLKFYIKPQHSLDRFFLFRVVSYWNSTSNHN